MRISIIGSGVVGKAVGKGLLDYNHTVLFYDRNPEMVRELKEDGYDASNTIEKADIYFICTPEENVDEVVLEQLKGKKGLIVIKSTVPPGTTRKLIAKSGRHICHNPEFIREKHALSDFLSPDRIVIGECCEKHGDLLEALYKPFEIKIYRVTPSTSELAKLTSNAWLSTVITFWNEIGHIADWYEGVRFKELSEIVTRDRRISSHGSRFVAPYEGRCLKKDMAQLISMYGSGSLVNKTLWYKIQRMNDELIRRQIED